MSTTKKVFWMIVVGIVYFVFDTLLQAGSFKSIDNSFNGTVENTYHGVFGPEDLDWDRENNLLFISATNRRNRNAGKDDLKDGIYVLSTDKASAKPKLLATDFRGEFHPHGISLFKLDSAAYLYVVNHTSSVQSVELFRYENSFLYHLESYTGDKMFSPNDVVGDEIGKFYVTNDHGNRTENMQTVEEYLRMPYAYLLYYDGTEFSKAHQGMVYANGVNFSNDGSKLYVTHTTGHEVFVLDRKKSTGGLILKETLNLGSGVDNIDVDENDVIWVAAHPKLLDFVAHAKDSTLLSPSQIFKIVPSEKAYKVTKVYENDGAQISGASVAVVNNKTIFVGCVFDDKVLKLKLK